MDLERLHRRAREERANPVVYGLVRLTFQPFFHVYFRFKRIGRKHIPARGPVIVASNHRSFLDPFVIACMAPRPMYYVAKKEIFRLNGLLAWLLSALGAFPVDRGAGDADMIATARAILARGDIVLIFPEGTRIRPGALGVPRRGVGRLALESGAPVVPLAVHGTEAVRRGWRIRPHKVRLRAGPPLRFPQVQAPSPRLAGAVTDRIWPCVMLQWEWLGGRPPARRVAVIGAGAWGTSLAVCLARAGLEVQLGCDTAEQAEEIRREGENVRRLPGVRLPDTVVARPATDLALEDQDLVVLAVSGAALPGVLAAHGGSITRRTGVLVVSQSLVGPRGTLPSTFTAECCDARAVAVLGGLDGPSDLQEPRAAVLVGCADRGLARELAQLLSAAGLEAGTTTDVTGVEFAGCASRTAVLAASAVGAAGPAAAEAAADAVIAEIAAVARARGAQPETLAGLIGAEAAGDCGDRRAGELLTQGALPEEIGQVLGDGADALESVALLAGAAREARIEAPVLERLAALVQGPVEPERWAAAVGAARPAGRRTDRTRAA